MSNTNSWRSSIMTANLLGAFPSTGEGGGSMYLVKRYLLPQLYWHGMLKGIP